MRISDWSSDVCSSDLAAALMFAPELSERHFSDAKATGAAMSFSVTFSYRDANSGFEREGKLNISTPGTKVTPKLALYVAQQFLGRFIENDPVDDLISAKCTVSGTSQQIGRASCRERVCQYV